MGLKNNRKGQFFIISIIIVILAVVSMMEFLVLPFGITVSELDRLNTRLLSAESFMENLEESERLLDSWLEPTSNNRIILTVSNNASKDSEGLYITSIVLGGNATETSIRIYDENNRAVNFSYIVLNATSKELEISIPVSILKANQKRFFVYYLDDLNSKKDIAPSKSNLIFNATSNTILSPFYSAKLNLSTKGNAAIYSLVSSRSGNDIVNNSEGGVLFNVVFAGLNQTDSNLSILSWNSRNTAISEIISATLTNGFNINISVQYEFFDKYIRAAYDLRDRVNSTNFSSFRISPRCSHNWTLSAGAVVNDYCANITEFQFNDTNGKLVFRSENNESFVFIVPLAGVEHGNYTTGVYEKGSNHSEIVLPNSSGIILKTAFENSSNNIRIDAFLMLAFNKTDSGFSDGLEVGVSNALKTETEKAILGDEVSAFRDMTRSIVKIEGVSTVAVPYFKDYYSIRILGNEELYQVPLALHNSSLENASYFDYVSRFTLLNANKTPFEKFPYQGAHVLANGSLSSFTVMRGNTPIQSQIITTNFNEAVFNRSIKNYNETTSLNYSLYNPTGQEFNITLKHIGAPGINVSYRLWNPASEVVSSGNYSLDNIINSSNGLAGFYILELQSGGDWDERSSLDMITTLSGACLSSDKFSFSGNQRLLLFVDEGVERIELNLGSTSSGSVYIYTLTDLSGNVIANNTFNQGETVSVALNLPNYIGGRFLELYVSDINPLLQASWVSVEIVSGVTECIGSSTRDWVNSEKPKVSFMSLITMLGVSKDEFGFFSDDFIFNKSEYMSVFWNDTNKVLNNSAISLGLSPINLDRKDSKNWLQSFNTFTSQNNSSEFSQIRLIENGSLRKVVNAIASVDNQSINYNFISVGFQDFFEVVINNFSTSKNPLTIAMDVLIANDTDRFYRIYGGIESEIHEGINISSEEVSCTNGYTYAGKKDISEIFALIIPCSSIPAGNNVFSITNSTFNASFSRLRDEIRFYVYASENHDWQRIVDLIERLNALKKNEGRIIYDWTYSSDDLIVN